jgi:hypothetical protein
MQTFSNWKYSTVLYIEHQRNNAAFRARAAGAVCGDGTRMVKDRQWGAMIV